MRASESGPLRFWNRFADLDEMTENQVDILALIVIAGFVTLWFGFVVPYLVRRWPTESNRAAGSTWGWMRKLWPILLLFVLLRLYLILKQASD